ncbi:hypothetical protein CMV_024069 [Castanea mollissima]|uniref:Uncharacterized protein n=1 Tax=Castanea mollissima TaxID=60419 RepID=A0A8J4QEX2_9ROSI|nr:hypothetical protein CMV_024069 [Castanea mollissima]
MVENLSRYYYQVSYEKRNTRALEVNNSSQENIKVYFSSSYIFKLNIRWCKSWVPISSNGDLLGSYIYLQREGYSFSTLK